MFDKYTLGLIAYIGITLSQIILNSESECTCSQVYTPFECSQFSPICQWVPNTQGGGNCKISSCQGQVQADCVKMPYCSFTNGNCYSFSGHCSDLNGAEQPCNQQNSNCYGNSTICSYKPTVLSLCSDYGTSTDCKISSQGNCYWNGTACFYYQNCNQIPISQCASYKPFNLTKSKANYCQVMNNQCVQSECSYQNQSTCNFVQTLFNADQFILCSWNSTSKQCQNAYSTSNLTNTTCFTNTMGNYRWIYKNNQTFEGHCFQCDIKPKNLKKQCSCEQLISEYDCYNAEICQWQNGRCYTPQCSQLYGQQTCYKMPNCAWTDKKGCLPYNRCQNLNGTTTIECLSQSLYCPESNGYQCLPPSKLNKFGCTSGYYNGTYETCMTLFSSFGYCGIRYYSDGQQQCVFEANINCYQYSNDQQECNKFQKSCYWYSTNPYYGYGQCYQANCQFYTTQESCTYILSENLEVIDCQWKNNQCYDDYSDQQTKQNYSGTNYQNCFTASYGQYRWSSNSDKQGTCIQCSTKLLPQKKTQCTCDQLIYQGDCAQASQSCLWNFQTSQCVNITCDMLKTRSTCIENYNCHWISVRDGMKCLPFTNCTSLPGDNSYQCLLYSYRCTQSNGQYCKELSYSELDHKCSSLTNYTACYLSIGSDGVCAWNGTQCYSLSQCSQIQLPQLCGINTQACYWNYISNTCQPLTCSQIINQDQCTYYDSTINMHPQIQMCYWVNSTCQNLTSTKALTSSDCYANSGNTYRWSENNSTDGDCESCSFAKIIGLLIFSLLMIQ